MQSRRLDLAAEYRAHFAPTHARLDDIEQMPPGPARMAALAALRTGPVDSAAALRMKVLNAGDRAWHDAQDMIDTYELVHGVGHLPGTTDLDRIEISVAELAPALRIGTAEANHRIALGLTIADLLPHCWVALSRGQLSIEHVTVIWRVTENCTHRVTEAVDAAIVPLAIERGWTPEQIRKHARKAILTIDPDGADERARTAKRADTDVHFYPESDQMGTVRAHGEAATARQIYDTINARAAQMSQDPTDTRSAGQRRFDAMAEFVLGTSATGDGASPAQQRARRRGEAQVRLDLTTALGLDDKPGFLDGYGPITAQLARKLAADATWRRSITDPLTSQLLDLGRTAYTPTAALREFIEARDQTCRMVGCERPARRCQIDHKTEWDKLGCTDCANLHPLCQMHHQQKTKKRWKLKQTDDGDTWTSALGFTYRRNDTPYLIPPLDPPDDLDDIPEPRDAIPLLAKAPPPALLDPFPDEPPLDAYEAEELYDVLDNSWGEFSARAYNLLRAAQLIA